MLMALWLCGCTPGQLSLQQRPLDAAATAVPAEAPPTDLAQGTPPTSVWQRLTANFSLPQADHPQVAQQRALLLKHPNHLSRTQEQAEPYIGFILDEIERRDMPGELALLPMIESGYRPQALSPSRAAGLWQFIPATGRAFGLSSNHWYEGRQDVAASTKAALDYLSRIHADFDHDWALTLAAYNAGEPALRRAIRNNRKRGRPTDFWSLDLPRETRAYVPKLLALKEIFESPERYGIELKSGQGQGPLQLVDLDSPMDLGLVARLAEIGMERLRQLNPGFKSWFTGPSGPHRLLLPAEKAEQFSQRLAQVPLAERLRLRKHRVSKGDTLAKLAAHYNCDVALIKSTNNLKSDRLKVASTLLIPTPYPIETATKQAANRPASRPQPAS
ncbi:MAG: transglycosylase SLT domain-containing protein [Gammaproteobacteria bacterium SHHR-1]